MLMICGKYREPDKRDGIGRHGTRPNAGFDLRAVRSGTGAALRTLHSDVLREAVPDRIAELLRQLDPQEHTDNAQRP
jgi:anti-sigma factor NepR-like protein